MKKRRIISKSNKKERKSMPRFYLLAGIALLLFGFIIGTQYIQSITKAQAQLEQDTIPPTVPMNLKVNSYLGTTKDQGSRDVLTWDPSVDNVGVKSYLVYQIVSGTVYDPIPLAETTTPSYTRQFTINGYSTDYSYYVVAVDLSGNKSPQSNIAHMTGIWGDVFDKSNYRYIIGAKVVAVGNGTTTTYTTNKTGAYLINLAPDTYDVTYSASGYIPQKYSLTVVDNQMTTRNIFLSKSRR